MMSVYSLLIIITFKSAFCGEIKEGECNNPKEPMKIPYENENPIKDFISDTVKYLCPAETQTDIDNLNKTPSEFYEIKYCLFNKTFKRDDVLECQVKVNPIFVVFYDPTKESGKLQCGKKESQNLYTFGYYYCGDKKMLKEFRKEEVQENPRVLGDFAFNIRIYDICYDKDEERTLWTRHTIQHPELFQETVNRREFYCPEEISTDPFYMASDLFLKLKRKYEAENKKKILKGHKIRPHHLVPLDHLALRMWKKTANHYINTAPLREHFVPLMKAIDEGIKRAAQKIYFQDDKKINDFFIFTKVTRSTSESFFGKFMKLLHVKTSESNIWYKVVYSFTKHTALTIVLHNSDGKPPKKKCKQATCDFKQWTEDERLKKDINKDKLNYAYCCQLTTEEFEELFSLHLNVEGFLDINTMMVKKT